MPRTYNPTRSIFASVLLWLLALGSLPAMAVGTYYVSPTGSDTNTGGISDPFLTITKAQTALRAAGGGTVYLRGGTYTLTSTVVFTNQDSNSTYQAYTGEVPIISGGVVLNNWTLYSGDIYRASVNWNFRGLFKDGVRLNYKNPITYTYPQLYLANQTFTDSAGPSSLVSAGDWALDYANGFVYYKTGGGAPSGTIVAGSLGKLFQITGAETAKIDNITFDHLYFFYNNWLLPGGVNPTYTDSFVGNFVDPFDSTKVGVIPGAVEVEFVNNATFRSCRIAHNASDGIVFGRGVINSQVVGSEVWDNGGIGILFGWWGNTTADGWKVPSDLNGLTLTQVWDNNANWIEDSNVVTDNYVHDNGKTYITAADIDAGGMNNLQINYNRTDNSQFCSIVAGTLYGAYYKADYNHISRTSTNSSLRDCGGIYSLSGQLSPNVGITGEYIGNLVHDANGYGPLYIDTSNDQFTVNNNVTYNYTGGVDNPLHNNGNHATLSGNNISPTQAQIDAAAASTGPRSPYYADLFGGGGTVTVDDASPSVTYSAGSPTWYVGNACTSCYLGTHSFSNVTNAYAQFTFTGTSIQWIGEKDNNRGNADVYIDGVFQATVDTYNASTLYQQVLYQNTTLSSGSHTIKIVVKGTKNPSSTDYYISVDEFTYSTGAKTDDASPSVTYSAGSPTWYVGNACTPCYLGTHSFSNVTNAYAQFTFTGTSIQWIGEKDNNRGNADVYIDGVFQATVDTYNASTLYQQVLYQNTTLPSGSHTIKIVVKGTKNPSSSDYYISVDAFQ